jgi:hypothetical protein
MMIIKRNLRYISTLFLSSCAGSIVLNVYILILSYSHFNTCFVSSSILSVCVIGNENEV